MQVYAHFHAAGAKGAAKEAAWHAALDALTAAHPAKVGHPSPSPKCTLTESPCVHE